MAVPHLALQVYGVEVPAKAEAEKPRRQVLSDNLTKPTIGNKHCVISFRFTPWTQRPPEVLVPVCPKRGLGCSVARGRHRRVTVRASPQRTGWENWVCVAGGGLVQATVCCHVESSAVAVPRGHGPAGAPDGSCACSRRACAAGGGLEASAPAFVLGEGADCHRGLESWEGKSRNEWRCTLGDFF